MIHVQQAPQPSRGIDLTPMLDVVFIMLIFFIVTAVFVREVGLDLPSQDAPSDPPQVEAIVVETTAAGRVRVAGLEVGRPAVGAHLQRLRGLDPEAPVVLRPHPDTDVETLVYVMDEARRVGIMDLKIASG